MRASKCRPRGSKASWRAIYGPMQLRWLPFWLVAGCMRITSIPGRQARVGSSAADQPQNLSRVEHCAHHCSVLGTAWYFGDITMIVLIHYLPVSGILFFQKCLETDENVHIPSQDVSAHTLLSGFQGAKLRILIALHYIYSEIFCLRHKNQFEVTQLKRRAFATIRCC